MRKFALICAAVVAAVIVVESFSSYFLYRYFAWSHKGFHPTGTATYTLLEHAFVSIRGKTMRVKLSSNRLPVFVPDPVLGYVMNPGEYDITEDFDHQKHMFHLHVTEGGSRAASYLPVKAAHRLFFTGDSSVFGWGLNDEETIPWLLQSRLPNDEVLNLSLTSYSTVQAAIWLARSNPKIGAEDSVILTYHPVTNYFNVAKPSVLTSLLIGYELQLGDLTAMKGIQVPYGAIDANGNFEVRRVGLSCATSPASPACVRADVGLEESVRVTERAFDEVLALHPGHVVVAFVSGPDDDPVIRYLREKGVAIADLRRAEDAPDAEDIVPTDRHAGPFFQYGLFQRLLAVLRSENAVH